MKILVIGNGFLGSVIIRRLEADGHELLIYSRSIKEGIRGKQIIGDIFSFEDFVKVFSWKPEVIVHTAWVTAHGSYVDDPSNYKYGHFTSKLAHLVATTDVSHLIVLGSCAEYGTRSEASTAGFTKLKPNNLYAQQKMESFISARDLLRDSGVRMTWARIFQPYGPGQDKKRLVPYIFDTLKQGGEVQLRDTSTILDWITTRDIASAISFIIRENTVTEVDIGTSIGFTNIELLRHLEEVLGNTKQWERLAEQSSNNGAVSLVGKKSPLFKSGWLPGDSLYMGLEWAIKA
jgi:dTDP-6-deoxy-L-talose 4-dehydrogenase (NAD+)